VAILYNSASYKQRDLREASAAGLENEEGVGELRQVTRCFNSVELLRITDELPSGGLRSNRAHDLVVASDRLGWYAHPGRGK